MLCRLMSALLACQCGTGEVRKIVVSAVATFNVRLAGAQLFASVQVLLVLSSSPATASLLTRCSARLQAVGYQRPTGHSLPAAQGTVGFVLIGPTPMITAVRRTQPIAKDDGTSQQNMLISLTVSVCDLGNPAGVPSNARPSNERHARAQV